MSARILLTSVLVLAGAASPALAFHPCGGGGTHFFGLTWGHSPAPRSFGAPATGQAFGVPFSVAPSAVPFSVTPFSVTPSAVPFGVAPFSVVPTTVVPFSVVPSAVRPSAEAEAQAVNWLDLVLRGSQFLNGATGTGVTSRDIATLNTSVQSLKTELAALRATNEKIYKELVQIRKGEKTDPPSAPKKDKDPNAGEDKSQAPKAAAPAYAQVDRDLNDIAALQKRIAEKEAKMAQLRAARNPVPNGTGVASNR